MKIGDKVRFLSEVGGGVVTGFQGKDMVLVEDADGFDIPMPIKECVVIDTDDCHLSPGRAKGRGYSECDAGFCATGSQSYFCNGI